MSFGADCLINKLNTNITGLGATNQTSLDFAQLGGALNSLENSFCSVATINDLPAASDNEGRFIYVTGCRSFRYSDGYEWLMNACSVCNATTSLFTWGNNPYGNLGNGTTLDRSSPGTVAGGGANWCWISGGGNFSSAIKTDGTLWTWGCNILNQLGDGTTLNRCSPGTIAGGGTTWCRVDGGGFNNAAIKIDGTLWTWGGNNAGQLGDGTTVNKCSPVTVAGGGIDWCRVFVGDQFNMAIKCDGTLWTWGCNCGGALGDGTTLNRSSPGTVAGGGTNWCHSSGGAFTSFSTAAIKCDGTLWTWGCNRDGKLGDGTTLNRCSPGTTFGSAANWCWVSVDQYHSVAVKCDGTLWTWGGNTFTVLGDGTTLNRCSPGTVAGGGTTWCQVYATRDRTAAIKTDGTIWTWGFNGTGNLGDGTTVNRCSPGTIAGGGTTWCRVFNPKGFQSRNVIALKSRGF